MLERYILSQHALQPLTDDINLAKYHDIYDISLEELAEAESSLNERETDDQYSLRALRTLFGRLYTVRKSILCCLLALGADGGGSCTNRPRGPASRCSPSVHIQEVTRYLSRVVGVIFTLPISG